MATPQVDKQLLKELESMGFPTARATRALHFSGSNNIEEVIMWVFEHEGDPDIDQMPFVPVEIKVESESSWMTPDEVNNKLQYLRERTRKRKHEEETKSEREREKNRIRAGKQLTQAKSISEENERKRTLLLKRAEKEELRIARAKILQQLENDKAERRGGWFGGQPQSHKATASSTCFQKDEKRTVTVRSTAKAEPFRSSLRSMKKHYKDEEARVMRAFQTLLTLVGNVARSPEEEKFRKIRLSNPKVHDRIGKVKGAIEFLELCGFEKLDNEYLYLPRDKVDMSILYTAGSELNSALTNPFFGLLSG